MKRILVVGSLNMDIVIETPCMPKAGETIAGKSIAQIPGGKGANQAFAAGKLGGNIAMMGAVGNDEKGEKLLESLKGVGVDISRIEVMNDIPTGQAFITVDDQGENAIIIIAGANGKVTKELIDSNLDLIKQSDIIIMQLEIPLEIVGYVKKIVFPNEIKKLSAYWRHSVPYLNKIKLVFTGESLPKLASANADFPMDSVVYVPKGRIKTYKKAYQRKYNDMDLKWEELK